MRSALSQTRLRFSPASKVANLGVELVLNRFPSGADNLCVPFLFERSRPKAVPSELHDIAGVRDLDALPWKVGGPHRDVQGSLI